MANKRELKKAIHNTCGELALEIVMARDAFPVVKTDDVRDVVLGAARLQVTALSHVNVSFDRTPSQFANRAEYNKARHAFFKAAYAKLDSDFNEGVGEIVKKMNSALPDEARQKIKEALG